MKQWLTVVACAVLLLAACAEPLSRERFIISDGSGEYSFPVEMNDSSAVYDLSFYTVIDRSPLQPDTLSFIPMALLWRSPSGRYFSENVYYPADSLQVCYRRGLEPVETGTWVLEVSVDNEPEGMRGLGLIVAKKSVYLQDETKPKTNE